MRAKRNSGVTNTILRLGALFSRRVGKSEALPTGLVGTMKLCPPYGDPETSFPRRRESRHLPPEIRLAGSSFILRIATAIFLSVLIFLSAIPCRAQSVEITDDLGRKISLAQPATRIIPLYGAFAEMLFTIGAGDRIIARTQADRHPEAIVGLPSIGTHMKPNIEMILGLKPDLVIMSAARMDETPEISRLIDSGIPVAVFSPRGFDGIFSVIGRLGTITGNSEKAAETVLALQKRLDAVRDKLSGIREKQKVFFEIRAEPLTGAGRGSIVQEIIEAAGGENVLKNDKAIVNYSLENLLFQNPDVYVIQEGPMNKSPLDPRQRAHFEVLKCVREGRIVKADEMLFSRPGPRCVDAVERLAAVLYPDMFK